MRIPRQFGHDLDETTQLYVDIHIAVELFHMRYPVYIALTTPAERQMYQMYIALKNAKERHAQWHAEHDRQVEETAMKAIDPRTIR